MDNKMLFDLSVWICFDVYEFYKSGVEWRLARSHMSVVVWNPSSSTYLRIYFTLGISVDPFNPSITTRKTILHMCHLRIGNVFHLRVV